MAGIQQEERVHFVIVVHQEEDAMALWKPRVEDKCSVKARECKAEIEKGWNMWNSSLNYGGEGSY